MTLMDGRCVDDVDADPFDLVAKYALQDLMTLNQTKTFLINVLLYRLAV